MFPLSKPKLLFLGVVHFLHRLVHVFVRLFHCVEFFLLLRREQRTDLRPGAFHDRFHLVHRFLMDGRDLWFRLIDDRLHLGLLIRREVEGLAQMLKLILHVMFRPRSVFVLGSKRASAGILSLKIGQTAKRESAGGHECDKFSCHCFVCFLFFSAIRAPLSRMDDRNRDCAVTNFSRKFFRPHETIFIL